MSLMTRLKRWILGFFKSEEPPTYEFKVGNYYSSILLLRVSCHKLDGSIGVQEFKPDEILLLVSASTTKYIFQFLSMKTGEIKQVIMKPEAFFHSFKEEKLS